MMSPRRRSLLLAVSLPFLLAIFALWYQGWGIEATDVAAQSRLLGLDSPGGPWQSGVKVQNLGQRAGTVVLEFLNVNGKVVGSPVTADLVVGASREFHLTTLPIPNGAYSARLRSDVPVAAVALQTDYTDGLGDSYNAVGRAAEVGLPFIFRGGEDWYSTVYVQNTTGQSMTVGLGVRRANGRLLMLATEAIPGRGRVSFDLASASFSSLGDFFNGSGVITATPGTGLAVTVVQTKLTDSTHTMASLPGLYLADAGRRVALPALYRQWRGWRSRIRVVNYSLSNPVTATIAFRSYGDSSSPGRWVRRGLAIPPGGFVDFDLLSDTLNNGGRLPEGFHGSAIVSATGPIQAAVVHTNGSGDEAMSQSGIPLRRASGRLAFPSLYNKFGQGPWQSRIRVQNVDSTKSVTVKFTFRADDGLSLQGTWTKTGVAIPPQQSYDFVLEATRLDGGETLPDEFRGSATVEVTSGSAKLVGAGINANEMRHVATMYSAIAY